ncbi:MAG: adenosine deaminase [Anaerolineales bacterium]|nr:adenosine deaminase [Anaerolineales bacterium]
MLVPHRKSNAPTEPLNVFQAMPKVDLHRHLEGSLRLDTMLDIARAHGVTVPASIVRLSQLVQIQEEEPYTFQNFLAKFQTLRLFYRSPDVINRVTREAVQDAARDNVKYMELRFTPVALSRAERFPLHDVMDWVCTSASEAAVEFGIEIALIASVNRHESVDLAEQVALLAAQYTDKCMVGMDIAGNEAEFSAKPFIPVLKEARQSGLQLTIHAGEWAGAANVREAIEDLNAERIGHGVRVMEDAGVVALARERGTVFEVCVTSNHQSGVVPELKKHPLKSMLDAGLKVTINTDDPSVSRITLSHEYRLIWDQLGVSTEALKNCVLTAARAAFLPEARRESLVSRIEKEMQVF